MTGSEVEAYIGGLNAKVRPVARALHKALVGLGCSAYVKTIYVGYDLGGEMVAAAYGHADRVEVALAIAEDHADPQLVDASHLTWRTLPLALNLASAGAVKQAAELLAEACDRVREQTHDVHRDNDFFMSRKQRRREQRGS